MTLITKHFSDEDWKRFATIWGRLEMTEGEHWLWRGARNSFHGHPIISAWIDKRQRQIQVARWLYTKLVATPLGVEVDKRYWVIRTCEEELCVYPFHHSLKTLSEASKEANEAKRLRRGLK